MIQNQEVILIAGGSGQVGRTLRIFLEQHGYHVRILTRGRTNAQNHVYHWNPETDEIDSAALPEVAYVINLSGANVAGGRWTNAYKKEMLDSRVLSNEFLYRLAKEGRVKPKKFISASAIGYYPSSFEKMDEDSKPGDSFLSRLCIAWEKSAFLFQSLNIPVATVRTAIVLSKKGGFLEKLKPMFKMGMGVYFGNGQQKFSWIHEQDLCAIYLHLIQHNGSNGPYNASSPHTGTNKSNGQLIAKVLRRPFWLPGVPAFLLKIALGDMSYELLVSHDVAPKRLLEERFIFRFPDEEAALRDCLLEK